MQSRPIDRTWRFRLFFPLAASVVCLAACGGSGNGVITTTLPGQRIYVTSADAQGRPVPGAVYQLAINADGSLTPLAEPSLPTGVTPKAMIYDQPGGYLYVANLGDATISQYAVTSAGLTPMSAPTVAIPTPFADADEYWLSEAAFTNSLYVVANSASGAASSVAEFSIGSDGALTPLTPAYVELSAAASGPLAFAPDGGRSAYLAGAVGTQSGQVAQFSVGPDGALSALTPATIRVAGTPTAVAIYPVISFSSGQASQTAYVLSRCVDSACDGEIALYSIGADGTLSATGASILTGGNVTPLALVTHADEGPGAFSTYVLANLMGVDTNAGAIYQYASDATGNLNPYTPASLAVSSGAVAEGVYGNELFALSANQVGFPIGPPGGHVDHYFIGPGGLLTAAGTTPVPGNPTALVVPALTAP